LLGRQSGWLAERPEAGSVGRAAQLLGQRSGRRTGWMAQPPEECSLADSAGRPADARAARHAGGTARAPAAQTRTRSRIPLPLHDVACRRKDGSGALAALPEDGWTGKTMDGSGALAEPLEDVGEDGADDADARTNIPLRELACRLMDASDAQVELLVGGWSGRRKDASGALAGPPVDADAAADVDERLRDAASRAQTRSRKIPPLCEPACRRRDEPGALAALP